jgi:hypothetical protein
MTTPLLPPLVSFPDLLRSAVAVVTSRVAEDARRNANEAFEALQSLRDDSAANRDLISGLRPPLSTAYRELA